MEITCKHCQRYLFKQVGTVVLEGIICPYSKCKAKLNFKITDSDSSIKDIRYKFKCPETEPKKKEAIVS